MKIKEKTRQHRRDFWAIYECEGCGYIDESSARGYDDRFYHDKVIPTIKCPECGKSRDDLGITGEYTETMYPEGFQI